MKRIHLFLLIFSLVVFPGCTNFLYQGEITAQDSFGKERHFVLYWTKTDPFIGEAKAGPAILLTECSPLTRIDFSEQPEGIVFRGTPGLDQLAEGGGTDNQNLICGKFVNYSKMIEVIKGILSLTILCKPVQNEFAVQPRNYLAAVQTPYNFSIEEKIRRWSFFGETLPGPSAPECRESRN